MSCDIWRENEETGRYTRMEKYVLIWFRYKNIGRKKHLKKRKGESERERERERESRLMDRKYCLAISHWLHASIHGLMGKIIEAFSKQWYVIDIRNNNSDGIKRLFTLAAGDVIAPGELGMEPLEQGPLLPRSVFFRCSADFLQLLPSPLQIPHTSDLASDPRIPSHPIFCNRQHGTPRLTLTC